GIGRIRQALGMTDKDAVRGALIKLVARGEVETPECSNGVYWRAHFTPKPAPVEVADGVFILQRELADDHRQLWFDVERFTNRERAMNALRFAESDAQSRAMQDNPRRPMQQLRLISPVVSA